MPQIIKTRTIVYKILGVALDAFVYNEAVRRVRNKLKSLSDKRRIFNDNHEQNWLRCAYSTARKHE